MSPRLHSPSTDVVRVILEAVGGGRFRATREDGGVLVRASRDPEHAACRALLAAGVTGTLVTRWAGSSHDATRRDIERSARRMTMDSGQGLRNVALPPALIAALPADERRALDTPVAPAIVPPAHTANDTATASRRRSRHLARH